MTDQLYLIKSKSSLSELPSAKLKKEDKKGVHVWTNFYASYSENFVSKAINALDCKKGETLCDPFVGSGTTLVAGVNNDMNVIGLDLDPFACLLSRAKLAINFDEEKVNSLMENVKGEDISKTFSEEAINIFDEKCLVYATSIYKQIKSGIKGPEGSVFNKIINDRSGKYDSEIIALCSICIGAGKSASMVKGSNPTWFRKALEGEKDNIEALYNSSQEAAHQIMEDLKISKQNMPKKINFHVYNQDISKKISLRKNEIIDVVITSPPYLTRLDYVIKHYPYLAMLTGFFDFSIDEIRKNMIGTPKIVNKGEFKAEWGATCNETLTKIFDHQSYASQSYYIWTYYQYFNSIYLALSNIRNKLSKDGRGVIVLQDSSYKDISINLSVIFVEMLENLDFKSKIVKRDEVKSNMRSLNPSYKKNNLVKVNAHENVVYFYV